MKRRDWTEIFSPVVLSRGKNYFASGKVTDMITEDSGYYITVHDDRDYYVSIVNDGDTLLGMGCSCPEGERDQRCAHMAAALCALEKKEGRFFLPDSDPVTARELAETEVPKDDDEVLAFLSESELDRMRDLEHSSRIMDHRNADSGNLLDYHYFNYRHFMDGLNISEELMRDAKDLIRSRKIMPIQMHFSYEDEEKGENLIGKATLKSSEEGFRSWQADIRFDADKIQDSYCSSISCHYRYDRESYLQRTLCRHQVAAIILAGQYIEEHNPGDTTSMAGSRLLGQYRKENEPEGAEYIDGRTEPLLVEPYLTLDEYGSLSASFRLGSSRLFKIQDIPETLANIEMHREQLFGSKTMILLGRECFLPDSLAWIDYMDGVITEERQQAKILEERFKNRKDPVTYPVTSGNLALYGAQLDRFYETAVSQGKEIEITRKTGADREKDLYEFDQKDMNLVLEIHQDVDNKHNIFHGIILEGNCPEIFYGSDYAYYLKDRGFYRIPAASFPPLRNILSAAREGKIRIRIGRIHLARFYYRILPQLKEHVDIIEYDHDEIMKYLPPKPEFITYLDVDENSIFARSEVFYGENVFFVTDLIDEEAQEKVIEHFRDRDAEYEVLDILRRYLPGYSKSYQILYSKKNEERVYEFLDKGIDSLALVSEIRATPAFKRLRLVRRARFQVGVNVGNNLMDLRVSSEDLTREELLDILHQYKTKKKYVRLRNGDYFKIDENETVEALSRVMESLHLTPREFVEGKTRLPAYRALYLDKMIEKTQDVYTNRNQNFTRLIKEFKTVEDADYELPPTLRDVLRNYQVTGYRWLRTLDDNAFGGILADDMGLGKTLQVIAVLLADKLEHMERSEELPATTLVVCPASLVYNWIEELYRFAPELVVKPVTGSAQERERIIGNYKDVDVLITSYDLVRRDISFYEDCLFRYLVVDEAQYIKNPQTGTAKSIKLLAGVTRFALTGTPIENRLSELWSIFDYLMPGCLYRYSDFKEEFEIPITRKYDQDKLEILQKMVRPFILRRMKEDVLSDLPEKLEEVYYSRMEDKQQALYDGQVIELMNDLGGTSDADFKKNKLKILSQLTRLRQICCDPALCFEDYEDGSAKRETCMELIRNLIDGEHKVIVFSQFTSMLSLLEEDLRKEEVSYYKITGSTPKETRVQLVSAFNTDETPVFLISLKAGGTGLNLTGADVVIHYDPWWNFAAQNQATDRAYRIGQTKLVTVYKLIAKGSIEEKILQLQKSKKKLADNILAAEGISSATLDKEDLLTLLSYDPEADGA